MSWDGILGAHPDRLQVPGVEVFDRLAGSRPADGGGRRVCAPRARPRAQRVFVLTGDAELNEGSNWEAIMHAGSVQSNARASPISR